MAERWLRALPGAAPSRGTVQEQYCASRAAASRSLARVGRRFPAAVQSREFAGVSGRPVDRSHKLLLPSSVGDPTEQWESSKSRVLLVAWDEEHPRPALVESNRRRFRARSDKQDGLKTCCTPCQAAVRPKGFESNPALLKLESAGAAPIFAGSGMGKTKSRVPDSTSGTRLPGILD